MKKTWQVAALLGAVAVVAVMLLAAEFQREVDQHSTGRCADTP